LSNNQFDHVIERIGTHSVKWDLTDKIFGDEEVLPMWVADMDFEAPNEVISAIKERLDHKVFGYTAIPSTTPEAISQWVKKRHNWEINQDWISYNPGVVTAMTMAIQAFTEPDDKIVIQTPVYQPFFHIVEKNKRKLLTTENILQNGRYNMNFEQLEEILTPDVKILMLCNPHNPGGRVWSREELTKLGNLCVKNDILILSDDIHSDIIVGDQAYTPIASISEEIANQTITFIAPTKTFNLAGLQASVVIIPNKKLKGIFDNYQSSQGFFTLNALGVVGMEAAYLHGEKWLDELISYLKSNIRLLTEFVNEQLPKIRVIQPEGTYLVWLDCRKLGLSGKEIEQLLIKKGKIGLEPGKKYGPGGEGFVRINLACSKTTLKEGLNRLKLAFKGI
jgi:cysteine-S-conjugate beta-lyase